MRLQEAHEKSKEGDRLRHMEYGIVIPRQFGFIETLTQMNHTQFLRTDDDNWAILEGRKVEA